MMTRKHFDAIARGLRDSHPELCVASETRKVTSYERVQWARTVSGVTIAIASVVPGFDKDRFLQACMVQR